MTNKTDKTKGGIEDAAVRIAILCLFLFVAAMTHVKIWDSDFWWHLKAGQVMTETQKMISDDPFSFTKSGARWINDEWMGETYLYSAYSKWGIPGVQGLAVGISLFICMALFFMAKAAGADPLLAIPLIGGAFWAARIRLTGHRPEMFSFLFIVAVFFILNRAFKKQPPAEGKKERNPASVLILIPFIQIFWANFHPSADFSLLLIGAAIAAGMAAFIANFKFNFSFSPDISSKTLRSLGAVLIATAIASLFNPYGLHALSAPFEFAREQVFMRHITEWSPIPFKHFFSMNGEPGRMGLPVFFALGVLSFYSAGKKMNVFHLLVFLATAFMAFYSRRFIAVFCLLSAPMIAIGLTPVFQKLYDTPRRYVAAACLVIFSLISIGYVYAINGERFIYGSGVLPGKYPDRAIDFVSKNDLKGEMFNNYELGGPLIWGLYPKHKVFIDGRAEFYGEGFFSEYLRFAQKPTPEMFNSLQKIFDFNFAVLKVTDWKMFNAIKKSDGGWRLIFWDSDSIVLAKSIRDNEEIIRMFGYSVADPFTSVDMAGKWKFLPAEVRKALVGELNRSLNQSPRNIIAIRALALISYGDGDRVRALKLARDGLKINVRIAGLHAIIGEIMLSKGRREEAIKEFKAAARIMPEYNNILNNIRDGESK